MAHRRTIIGLALKVKLPAIYEFRHYVRDGGLLSYAPAYPAMFRQAARYVDKILKGSNPADLPVERPTRFELVINRKTAESIDLMIPLSFLRRADEVIE